MTPEGYEQIIDAMGGQRIDITVPQPGEDLRYVTIRTTKAVWELLQDAGIITWQEEPDRPDMPQLRYRGWDPGKKLSWFEDLNAPKINWWECPPKT